MITIDEWRDLVFEYANNNKTNPPQGIKYKNQNVGTWINNQKTHIKSVDDKKYKSYLKMNILRNI